MNNRFNVIGISVCGDEVKIFFPTMLDADAFVRHQSSSPEKLQAFKFQHDIVANKPAVKVTVNPMMVNWLQFGPDETI
jgi:hypothetical protein